MPEKNEEPKLKRVEGVTYDGKPVPVREVGGMAIVGHNAVGAASDLFVPTDAVVYQAIEIDHRDRSEDFPQSPRSEQ